MEEHLPQGLREGLHKVCTDWFYNLSTAGTTRDNSTNLFEAEEAEEIEYMRLAGWKWGHIETYYVIVCFILVSALARLIFHRLPSISDRIPESCLLILLGFAFGLIIYYKDECNLHSDCKEKGRKIFPEFTPALFFYLLLPPIILEAAYALHNRVFMSNLRTVLLYAVVGTILNFLLIGGALILVQELRLLLPLEMDSSATSNPTQIQILLFASLISAVDPVAVLAVFGEVGVNPDLYYLVFGESLLNDGMAVVIYDMMKVFSGLENAGEEITGGQVFLGIMSFFTVAGGGLLVGVIFGIGTALLTRLTEGTRDLEPLALFSLAYLAYLTADMLAWSGILSLIGCGLVQAHYSFKNISSGSLGTVKNIIKLLSSTSDSIIFLYLGMALANFGQYYWDPWFICWTIVICLVVRFICTLFLTLIVNYLREGINPISFQEQVIMAYGGLRGAVGFSLVSLISPGMVPAAPLFVATTLAVVLATVFLQGTTIKPLVKILNIKTEEEEVVGVSEEIHGSMIDELMAGIEGICDTHDFNYFRFRFNQCDDMYFKKWFCVPGYKKRMNRLLGEVSMADHLMNVYGPGVIVRAGAGAREDGAQDASGKVNHGFEKAESEGEEGHPRRPSIKPSDTNLLQSVHWLSELTEEQEDMYDSKDENMPEQYLTAGARRDSRLPKTLPNLLSSGKQGVEVDEEAGGHWDGLGGLRGVVRAATRKNSTSMNAKLSAGGKEEVLGQMVRKRRVTAHLMREKISSEIIQESPEEESRRGSQPSMEAAVMELHRNLKRRNTCSTLTPLPSVGGTGN